MGHLLLVAKQLFTNQEIRNTFWFGGNDAVMANAQDLVDAVAGAWDDNLASILENNWSLYAFDVYDKTVPSVPAIEYTPTGGTIVGAITAGAMPTQIAMVVSFKAQVAPPNRNRKYLGGWPITGLTEGLFGATQVAAANAWANDILDIATTTSLAVTMEVVALLPDGTVSGSNPLASAVARANPGVQRRRRQGVGI